MKKLYDARRFLKRVLEVADTRTLSREFDRAESFVLREEQF